MMKRISCIAMAMFLTLGSMSAQKFRVEGGLTAVGVHLNKDSSNHLGELKMGYRAGAAVEIKVLPLMYISTGLNFKTGNEKVDLLAPFTKNTTQATTEALSQSTLGQLSTMTLSSNALSLPLNLGFRIKPAGILGISLEAGPYLSYALSSKINMNSPGQGLKDIGLELKDLVRSKKFGYGVGGSIALEITRVYLRAGVEYGLSDRLDFEDDKVDLSKFIQTGTQTLGKINNIKEAIDLLDDVDTRQMHFYVTLGFRI